MSQIRFEPIAERTTEIVNAVMAMPEIIALPDHQFQLRLAVEELVSNIVDYSTSPLIIVDVTHLEKEQILRITITDHGIPFNPLMQKMPDVTLSVEDRPIGGLGIFLVRTLMDRVSYSYKHDTNILTIEKDL